MATASPAALDDFLTRFTSQVGSGFGLIQGDVQGVFATLVVISLGLSALLWALDDNQNVPAALIRKILLFGFFAWLITSWRALSLTVVNGFVALGLKAGGGALGAGDLLNAPSKVVTDGLNVAFDLLAYMGRLASAGLGTGFFSHFDTILIAGVAAIGVIIAFLILGIEITVTIIEFHLVTLIAFVTVPFGILTQTAFLSERAIGYVVSVGVKLMALALIVSIGEQIFTSYTVSADPTWGEDCGLLLAAICLVMLALKIPAVAAALISGGPQLNAGSAVAGAAGVAAAVGGLALAGRMAAGAMAAGAGGRAASALAASGLPAQGPGGPGPGGGSGASGGGPDAAAYRRAPVASLAAQARASFSGRGAVSPPPSEPAPEGEASLPPNPLPAAAAEGLVDGDTPAPRGGPKIHPPAPDEA
jgi:type IV secretion system protein TrbL